MYVHYWVLEAITNIIVKENNELIRVADSKYSFLLGKNTEEYVNYITEDNIILINAISKPLL